MRSIILVVIISLFILFGAGCITDKSPSNKDPITIDTLTTFSAKTDRDSAEIILDGVTKQIVKNGVMSYTIDPKDLKEGLHSLSFKDIDTIETWNIIIVHAGSPTNPKSDEWYQTYEEQVRRAQERNKNATN